MFNINRFVLQELGKLWRVSDWEKLVGVNQEGGVADFTIGISG